MKVTITTEEVQYDIEGSKEEVISTLDIIFNDTIEEEYYTYEDTLEELGISNQEIESYNAFREESEERDLINFITKDTGYTEYVIRAILDAKDNYLFYKDIDIDE